MTLPRTPALATACVIFDPMGRVPLIRRGHEPCAGKHALPGGFVRIGETVMSACRREVKEETGIEVIEISLVGVYSDIERDPRGHVVSVAFMTELTTKHRHKQDRTRGAPNGSICATLTSHLTMPVYSLTPRPGSASKQVA